jgi:hypothetical protein
VDALNSNFLLSPVITVLQLAAQGTLGFRERLLVSPEAVERRVEGAVAQSGEANDSHINAHCGSARDRCFDFSSHQDRSEPFVPASRNGHVDQSPEHLAAVAVAYPTKSWQKNPTVCLIYSDLATVAATKAVRSPSLFERGSLANGTMEASVCSFQISECLLKVSCGHISQPNTFGLSAPLCEPHAKSCKVQLRQALLDALPLSRQRQVKNKSAATRNSAHAAQLIAGRPEFEFIGLVTQHAKILKLRAGGLNIQIRRKTPVLTSTLPGLPRPPPPHAKPTYAAQAKYLILKYFFAPFDSLLGPENVTLGGHKNRITHVR